MATGRPWIGRVALGTLKARPVPDRLGLAALQCQESDRELRELEEQQEQNELIILIVASSFLGACYGWFGPADLF